MDEVKESFPKEIVAIEKQAELMARTLNADYTAQIEAGLIDPEKFAKYLRIRKEKLSNIEYSTITCPGVGFLPSLDDCNTTSIVQSVKKEVLNKRTTGNGTLLPIVEFYPRPGQQDTVGCVMSVGAPDDEAYAGGWADASIRFKFHTPSHQIPRIGYFNAIPEFHLLGELSVDQPQNTLVWLDIRAFSHFPDFYQGTTKPMILENYSNFINIFELTFFGSSHKEIWPVDCKGPLENFYLTKFLPVSQDIDIEVMIYFLILTSGPGTAVKIDFDLGGKGGITSKVCTNFMALSDFTSHAIFERYGQYRKSGVGYKFQRG